MDGFDIALDLQDQVRSQSRIIEAMMRAHELENQYRAQGYSEAQIQQFHEGIMDKMFGKKKEEEKKGVMSRIGGGIKAAWNAVITWLKKIWYKMVNFFRSDEKFLKTYEADLKKNASQFQDIKINFLKNKANPAIGTTSTALLSGFNPNSDYDKMSKEYDETKVDDFYEETTVGKVGGVSAIIDIFKRCGEMSKFKEAIGKLEKDKSKLADNATDADRKKKYLKYIKSHVAAQLRVRTRAHAACRQALYKCLAVMRKSSKNEAMMLIEQVEINSNYLVESLLLEGEQLDSLIDNCHVSINEAGMSVSDPFDALN